MAKEVQISKGLLTGLLTALTLSLLGVAYLLGKQSAGPVIAQPTPHVTKPVARVTPASLHVAAESSEQSLSTRLDRIERRVDRTAVRIEATDQEPPPPARTTEQIDALKKNPAAPPAAVRQPPPPPQVAAPKTSRVPRQPAQAPPSGEDTAQRRAYFQQVDSILQNTASIDDPNQFATKFLQQAMGGDTSGFDSLSATTRQAKASLEKVTPPPACKEHHLLLLSQLSQSLVLLAEVNQAIASNDTSRLGSVAARGQEMQGDTERFQQLDRDLRRGL